MLRHLASAATNLFPKPLLMPKSPTHSRKPFLSPNSSLCFNLFSTLNKNDNPAPTDLKSQINAQAQSKQQKVRQILKDTKLKNVAFLTSYILNKVNNNSKQWTYIFGNSIRKQILKEVQKLKFDQSKNQKPEQVVEFMHAYTIGKGVKSLQIQHKAKDYRIELSLPEPSRKVNVVYNPCSYFSELVYIMNWRQRLVVGSDGIGLSFNLRHLNLLSSSRLELLIKKKSLKSLQNLVRLNKSAFGLADIEQEHVRKIIRHFQQDPVTIYYEINMNQTWEQFYTLLTRQFPYLLSQKQKQKGTNSSRKGEQEYQRLSRELIEKIAFQLKPIKRHYNFLIILDQASQYVKRLTLYYQNIAHQFKQRGLTQRDEKKAFVAKIQKGQSGRLKDLFKQYKQLQRMSLKMSMFQETEIFNQYIFTDKEELGVFQRAKAEGNQIILKNLMKIQPQQNEQLEKLKFRVDTEIGQNECFSMFSFKLQGMITHYLQSLLCQNIPLIMQNLQIDHKLEQIKQSQSANLKQISKFQENASFYIIAKVLSKFHEQIFDLAHQIQRQLESDYSKKVSAQLDSKIKSFIHSALTEVKEQCQKQKRSLKDIYSQEEIQKAKEEFKTALKKFVAIQHFLQQQPIRKYRDEDQSYRGSFLAREMIGVIDGQFNGEIIQLKQNSKINKKYKQSNSFYVFEQYKISFPTFPFHGKFVGKLQGKFKGKLKGKFQGTFEGKFIPDFMEKDLQKKQWQLMEHQFFYIAEDMYTKILDPTDLQKYHLSSLDWKQRFRQLAVSDLCKEVDGKLIVQESKQKLYVEYKKDEEKRNYQLLCAYVPQVIDIQRNFPQLYNGYLTTAISTFSGVLQIQNQKIKLKHNTQLIMKNNQYYKNFFYSFNNQRAQIQTNEGQKIQQESYQPTQQDSKQSKKSGEETEKKSKILSVDQAKIHLFQYHFKQFYQQIENLDKNQGIGAKLRSEGLQKYISKNKYFDAVVLMKDEQGQYLLITFDFTLDQQPASIRDKLINIKQFYNIYVQGNMFLKKKLSHRHYIAAPDYLVQQILQANDLDEIKGQIRMILKDNPHFRLAPISKIKFTSDQKLPDDMRWIDIAQRYAPKYPKNKKKLKS